MKKFREGEDWKLDTDQFQTGEREVSWVIKRKEESEK